MLQRESNTRNTSAADESQNLQARLGSLHVPGLAEQNLHCFSTCRHIAPDNNICPALTCAINDDPSSWIGFV
jgi:hypothetical protein